MKTAKAGRKPKHFIATDGTQVKGLARDAKARAARGRYSHRAVLRAAPLDRWPQP